jgi:hypothetical protein
MNKYGQLCYTYYLYHVPTGKKYYGSRTGNKCKPEQDLWISYFSSSDCVKELIELHGKDSFETRVQKIFNTPEEARYWEDRVHHKLKVVEREDWLNQAYAFGPFYKNLSGKDHPLFGTTWKDGRRQIASKRMSGSGNPMFGKTGKNHPMFGKTGKNHPRSKPVKTPLGKFDCAADAAKIYNITDSVMSRKCQNRTHGCEYV